LYVGDKKFLTDAEIDAIVENAAKMTAEVLANRKKIPSLARAEGNRLFRESERQRAFDARLLQRKPPRKVLDKFAYKPYRSAIYKK